mgnify:CR=1
MATTTLHSQNTRNYNTNVDLKSFIKRMKNKLSKVSFAQDNIEQVRKASMAEHQNLISYSYLIR